MKLVFLIFITLTLIACAGRKYPAPIVHIEENLSTYTETSRDSIKNDTYEVEKGETLYSIAWRAGIDFRLLAQLNNIEAPYTIVPGQQLQLSQQMVSAPTSTSNNQPVKQTVTQNKESEKNHQKTIAKEKSVEYGKKQANQKLKIAVHKETKKAVEIDSFPSKVRHWRYPSNGKIIDTYSTKENGNKGIDFGGVPGDPIIAAADGKVVYAGNALRGFGNLIIVKHNNDYLSAYAHNRTLKVKEQDWVKAGQVIADMGRTGTDKVKLHFEIRFRGRTVNPLKYLPSR